MAKITVVGSISTDFVVTVSRRPEIGETIEGELFETSFGGKGANQAVAVARLGAETNMVGAVGGDGFGDLLIANLQEENISIENVERVTEESSGAAFINIENKDNSIIYIPGANGKVTKGSIERAHAVLEQSDFVLIQNEVKQEAVEETIDYCYENSIPVLLNPAPGRPLDESYINKVTYLTPNETEFSILFPGEQMENIMKRYPNKLFITLGAQGVKYHDGNEIVNVDAFEPKELVDTTGAGDTFNGAFAVAVTNNLSIKHCVTFANLASSISIQKQGAQAGIPQLNEVKENEYYEKEWNIK
ncbi:ribokinase [Tetragenococcus halophilus]|uniref:ribokinase n=1 Tax=Tetragenococcus halophilus TaxID=51669 RepID=UPI000B92AFF7|nr:ribokinase [Tetragenococcus halophilus]